MIEAKLVEDSCAMSEMEKSIGKNNFLTWIRKSSTISLGCAKDVLDN